MKRRVFLHALFLLFLFIIPYTKSFAIENKISFSAGVLTGVPIYNSKTIIEADNSILRPNKIVFGSDFYINLIIVKEATFFFGGDFFSDLLWDSKNRSNHFHFSFPLGIKIYPNIGGFNVGISYVFGFRTDSIKTSIGEKNVEITSRSPWGNGFRFSAEYDFSHRSKSKYYPSLGIAWNRMPRGDNSFDNLIIFYLNSNF